MDKQETQRLINLMLEKSQESFLLAIETYNKPTIRFRVEGFSFFICNAWELLLKAYLLNRGESIYYKNKKTNQNRTISLGDAIKKIFTNDKDPLRKNLEIVLGIRHMATHLIIPDYAAMLNDIFTACVKNYSVKLKAFFNISIDEKIQSDFITMFIPRETNTIDIEGQYGKEIFKKYIDTKTFLSHSYAENINDNKMVNESFALSYQLTFKTVADVNAADFTMAKVSLGKSQVGVIKVQEMVDPTKTHPYSCKQLVAEVKKELNLKNITFEPISQTAKKDFTASTFNTLNIEFHFKREEIYTYTHTIGQSTTYTYSVKLVQRIINIFLENPDILPKIKEKHKKS